MGQSNTSWVIFSAAFLAAFLTFVILGMRHTSLQEIVEQVTDPSTEVQAATAPEDQFNARCNQIAERAHLTPRETQVFKMLARGRDRTYIEEELVISKNTVKAHVKHVYSKLKIHSHQELIDLVENKNDRINGD